MGRAILLIGVSRTANPGQFPQLPGVKDAIRRMREWAVDQKFETIKEVSEETADRVTAIAINDTIDEILRNDQNLERLIIYFSGHGIVNATNEYWLLSQAPQNSNEAVNVSGSVVLAEAGQIPHVVFISDACRTPANSIQLGRITGSLITPNRPNPDSQQYVDVFYATRLGAPAIEIASQSAPYIAVFTYALEMALGGGVPDLIDNGYIRPRPLGDWLKTTVPRLLANMRPGGGVSQGPEARICSPPNAWLSKITTSTHSSRSFDAPIQLDVDFLEAFTDHLPFARQQTRPTAKTMSIDAVELMRSLTNTLEYGLSELTEEDAGVVVLGNSLRSVSCSAEHVHFMPAKSASVMSARNSGHRQVLLEFDDGSGMLLPLLVGYCCVMRINDGRLRELHYEPARRLTLTSSREALQIPRSVIYGSVADGETSLNDEDTQRVSKNLTSSTFIDPALSAWAAYAYQGTSKLAHAKALQRHLQKHGTQVFDVSLMARTLLKADEAFDVNLGLPMLSQGWASIDALAPRFPQALRRLQYHVRDSFWCHYESQGVNVISDWLSGEGYLTYVQREGG